VYKLVLGKKEWPLTNRTVVREAVSLTTVRFVRGHSFSTLKLLIQIKNIHVTPHAMSPSKPRNAVYKDSVVSLLSLKAYFAVSDDHQSDKSGRDLGKLMLFHNLNAESGAPKWEGEYFHACTQFARINDDEMKANNCTVDQLLKGSAVSYYSGDALWKKAQDSKRVMLNEMHTVFCQEICRQWPSLPSGTTTLEPHMLQLRKVLWAKKAQELKDGRAKRAEVKVQEAKKVQAVVLQDVGMLSERFQVAKANMEQAEKEMDTIKAEALPDFEPDWYPTLWRAYMAYGPSMEDPHGHGGFLSTRNATFLSNGPLIETDACVSPQTSEGGRKRARENSQAKSSPASDSRSETRSEADGAEVSARLLVAIEKQVDISQHRQKIKDIRDMLDESGEFMDEQRKQALRKKLYELRMQSVCDGDGGFGV
jgi:hypothetical protein